MTIINKSYNSTKHNYKSSPVKHIIILCNRLNRKVQDVKQKKVLGTEFGGWGNVDKFYFLRYSNVYVFTFGRCL